MKDKIIIMNANKLFMKRIINKLKKNLQFI